MLKFHQSTIVLIVGIFINIQAIDSITTNQLKSIFCDSLTTQSQLKSIFTEIEEEKVILSNFYKKASNRPEIAALSLHEQISYLLFMSHDNQISKQDVVGIAYQLHIILELEKDYVSLFKKTRPEPERKILTAYIIKINQNMEFLTHSIEDLFSDQINIKKMTLNIVN